MSQTSDYQTIPIEETKNFHKCLQLMTFLGNIGKMYVFAKIVMYSDGSGYIANDNHVTHKSWNFYSIEDLYRQLQHMHADYLRDLHVKKLNTQLHYENTVIQTLFL